MKDWSVSDIDAILREAALLARLGRLDEAENRLTEANSTEPRLTRSHGQILAALGRWNEALDKFDVALAAEPGDVASWRAVGTIRGMLRDIEGAVQAFDRVLAVTPADIEALRGKADVLIGAGLAARAEPIFRALAAAGDAKAAVRHRLCLAALGNVRDADELYGSKPEEAVMDVEAALNAGREAIALSSPVEADRWYRRALVLRPESVEALTGLGSVMAASGRNAEALTTLKRAVAADGLAVYAREILATALLDDGQTEAARREIDALLTLDPGNAQGHALLAFATLKEIGRSGTPSASQQAEILFQLRAARDGRPDEPALILPVAELFNRLGLAGESASTLKALRRARRDSLPALFAAARATINVCDWEDYADLRRGVVDNVDNAIAANAIDEESLRLLAALGAPYAQAMKVAQKLAARHDRGYRVALPARASRPRIRIAYLQAQTRFHSTMAVARALVERHDRSRFEVHGYARHDRASSGAQDRFQAEYRAAFDVFRDVSMLDDRAAAARIAEDDIDILIELNGPGAENNMGVVACRPARLIAHYYGHAYGTGANYVDYLLVDRIYMPPDLAALGAEAPIYLPPSFMAAMPGRSSGKTLTRTGLGLPEDGVVFANFNHPWKFEPRGFGVWLKLLRAMPGSVLWVAQWNDAAAAHLRAEFDAGGLDPRRLVVAPTAAHDDHLARLAHADLALDPFLVAGGVTTYDALRAGLPVIARMDAAHTPSARMGASIVSAVGLGELVAETDDAYEALALGLARDGERRRHLRASLAARTAKALDLDRSTRHLDAAIEAMWRRHVAGLAPAKIKIAEQS